MSSITFISTVTLQPVRLARRIGAFVAKHGAAPKYDGIASYSDLYM
ncbi:MAG: hypothetical protein O3C10_10305 [Chloroflexi bacterium]|nr:hypothetical protein [Chloroflexota bacterium]